MFIFKIEAVLLGRDLDYYENVIHSLTEEWQMIDLLNDNATLAVCKLMLHFSHG